MFKFLFLGGVALVLVSCGLAPPGETYAERIPLDAIDSTIWGEQIYLETDFYDTSSIHWTSENDGWLVVTTGSSSCPSRPKELLKTSDSHYEILVNIDRFAGMICTADSAPTTFRIPAPVEYGTPITVTWQDGIIVIEVQPL